jgi:fucose permease
MAQAGGAIFPAITGLISARAGVATLQPMLVGLLATMVVAWCFVPDPKKKGMQ